MITDVEHLFMCLLAICVPSLEKYLLKLTPSFYQLVCFSGCLFVWAICLSLYASVFSRLVCCLFILSMAPFAVQKLSGLIWSHVFAFDFVSFALGDRSKIIHFMSKSILPCFLLGFLWFLVLYLDLWSFLRVVCVCVCVCVFTYAVGTHSNFILLYAADQFPQYHFLKRLYFPHHIFLPHLL